MNIFGKDTEGSMAIGKLVPFANEEQLEKYLFANQSLIGDVFILTRQIRGGNKSGIPDMVGIDEQGNVCVIEIKNVRVDSSIVPQVLQYAIWAETSPDSIKSLWLEQKNQPEDLTPNFEDYDVRIIVVAPSYDPEVAQHTLKINFDVDLVELNRYVLNDQEFVLVDRIEPRERARIKPAQGLIEYDRAFYEANYNKASVGEFFKYIEATKEFVVQQGWPLEFKMNKGYGVFKVGSSQAFAIHWLGSKSFAYFFKLSEAEAAKHCPAGLKMNKYSKEWKFADFKIEPGVTEVAAFLPLMKASMDKLVAT